jgi:hypothetical protein
MVKVIYMFSWFSVYTILVVALTLTIDTPAEAHTKSQKAYTYASVSNCTWGRADKRHGSGGGYHYAFTRSKYARWTPWGRMDCGPRWDRPAGNIAARYNNYKWNGESWQVCTYTNYTYNPVTRHYHQVGVSSGYYPPCGRGYYGTTGFSYVKNGGRWYGGRMWSGYHWLPV